MDTLAILQQKLDEALAENLRLQQCLIDQAKAQIYLKEMHVKNQQIHIEMEGNIFHLFCDAFANTFKASGATNYLVASFSHAEVGDFTVTMQRTEGLDVYAKLKQTTLERDQYAVDIDKLCQFRSQIAELMRNSVGVVGFNQDPHVKPWDDLIELPENTSPTIVLKSLEAKAGRAGFLACLAYVGYTGREWTDAADEYARNLLNTCSDELS